MKNDVNEQRQREQEQRSTRPYCDDEISLLDLLRVLVRQKKIIYFIFLFFLIVGVGYALSKPKIYRYTTTIEIGSIMEDGKTVLIDQPGTVQAKINEAYIPYVLEQHANANQGSDWSYEIEARIPRGSEVIVLESRAPENEGESLIELQRKIVEYVKRDHKRVFDIMKKEMSVELNKSKNKLAGLQDRHKVLSADMKRLDQTAKLLSQQVEELKLLVDDAVRNRQGARSQTGDESRAMTLLMIDNEIQQNTQRLAALEERLHIDLPRERDSFNKMIADNLREQQEQAAEIAKIQMAVNNMRETRALIAPMRSMKPVGTSRSVIVLTFALSGVIVGLLTALFVGFYSNIRSQLVLKDT
ncbi:MAG TPA: hypothetical protein ENK38_02545 [Gammaproteobacteria bacterium]|nr:hypothetical protein [Gammaproteobacteria bacterium]